MPRPSRLALLAIVLLCGAGATACSEMSDDVILVSPAVAVGWSVAEPSAGKLCGRAFDLPRETRRLPDFESYRPFGGVCTNRLDVSVRNGFPGFPGVRDRYEWFGVDFQGVVVVTQPGQLRFRLTSDDGSKLMIDDTIVLDNDGYHDVRTVEGTVALSAGEHRIRVPFYQGPGPLALVLEVARPGEPYEVFRADRPLVGGGEPVAVPATQ